MKIKTVIGMFATDSDFRPCTVDVRAEKTKGKTSISFTANGIMIFVSGNEIKDILKWLNGGD